MDEINFSLYRPFRSLSALINPPDNWVMAVVRAYIDDSGSPGDPNSSFLTMAGYSSVAKEWDQFEHKWAGLLEYFNIPYLHMKEFAEPESVYEHLKSNPELMSRFFMMATNIIGQGTLIGFSSTIKLKDLNDFNQSHGLDLDPYAIVLYGCFRNLNIYNKEFNDESIEIVVDKFERHCQRLELAFEYAATDADELSKLDVFSTICLRKDETSKQIYQLQAADFLAWETRKNHEDNKGFQPTYEERKIMEALQLCYEQYKKKYMAIHGKMPRERKSFQELYGDGSRLSKRLWTIDDLEIAHKRHPDGWTKRK